MDTISNQPIPFKAETRQLLNILIHSLYSEREIFLRELISNASDALTRVNFELLTNRNIQNPDAELAIWITANPDEGTLTIRDSGIGMSASEMSENLGTIAHSGARSFLQAAASGVNNLNEIIGQFGVGFYSAFMVAESIRVLSRSYDPSTPGAEWLSSGEDTFTIHPADVQERGTQVILKLNQDSLEFCQYSRLREIIKRHSDFIPFPIYLGDQAEQVNQQTALWRKPPKEVTKEQAHEFYRQLTLDVAEPLAYTHLNIDAPVQLYALLFIPASADKSWFSLRKEDGLRLYARKVLIQDYSREMLPEYLRFVQGVVDSEDIPLNVSRETVQTARIMPQLRKILTARMLELLKDLQSNRPDDYAKFWTGYQRYLKEGIATDRDSHPSLTNLLRFNSLQHPNALISLDTYVQNSAPNQSKIYYLLGDNLQSMLLSPHLELFRKQGVDVLLLSDPIDPFMLLSLTEFNQRPFANAITELPPASDEAQVPQENQQPLASSEVESLVQRFERRLSGKVAAVKVTNRLVDSPVRLVDPEGALQQEVQKVYQMLHQEFTAPKKLLEINPTHELIVRLAGMPEDDERLDLVIDQLYENALLIEGLHPNPVGMVERIQRLLVSALK